MPWHSLRGHDRVVTTLRRALARGRLPHAFLFVGPEGIGKRAFALRLAQALLCERVPEAELDPCGRCPGCLQVMAGTHPDLLQVATPEDKHELPIRVIRDLCIDLGLKPMSGRRKVAIIDDADDMNDEAANAFLKTLEEPPPGSTLILIGTSAEAQLDTILSRCRVVRFDPLPESELAELLLEQGIAETPEAATRLARLGEGSVEPPRGWPTRPSPSSGATSSRKSPPRTASTLPPSRAGSRSSSTRPARKPASNEPAPAWSSESSSASSGGRSASPSASNPPASTPKTVASPPPWRGNSTPKPSSPSPTAASKPITTSAGISTCR